MGWNLKIVIRIELLMKLMGTLINIMDLYNLKINKKASGRLKDLADLDNLP
jgi:hypothetical protein